jgi:hypothetical protein
VDGDFAIVAAKFAQLQPVGGILGVFARSVVAVMALGTLKRKVRAVSLWHVIKSSLNRGMSKIVMEPTTGIEPATYSLQNCCSTIELRRQDAAMSRLAKIGAG